MIDIIVTVLIPAIFILSVFFLNIDKAKGSNDSQDSFFNRDYTTTLKGIAIIAVVFVHVPSEYGNAVQDAIGSFAFVFVTFFFLVSAYGMQLAVETKNDYLSSFWKNRGTSLLIPMMIANIVCFLAGNFLSGKPQFSLLFSLNNYVSVLLTYCLWFYCLEMLGRYFKLQRKSIDIINISGVVISSGILYFTNTATGWCWERYGLVWGLLLYRYFPLFTQWLKKNERAKKVIFLIASLILGVVYLKYKYIYFWGAYVLKITLGLTILICLAMWSHRLNFKNKKLKFLGEISYEIFLCHAFIMLLLRDYSDVPRGLFITITWIASIIIAYLINIIGKPLISRIRNSSTKSVFPIFDK